MTHEENRSRYIAAVVALGAIERDEPFDLDGWGDKEIDQLLFVAETQMEWPNALAKLRRERLARALQRNDHEIVFDLVSRVAYEAIAAMFENTAVQTRRRGDIGPATEVLVEFDNGRSYMGNLTIGPLDIDSATWDDGPRHPDDDFPEEPDYGNDQITWRDIQRAEDAHLEMDYEDRVSGGGDIE